MRFLQILLLVICPLVSAFANEQSTLVLKDGADKFQGATDAYYLEDPSRLLTFDEVSSPNFDGKFVKNTKPTLNFGRSQSAWWVKLRIMDQSEQKWYLQLDAMLGEDFDLYVKANPDQLSASGEQLTNAYFKELDKHRRHAWSVNLPADTPVDIYMRVTNGNSIVVVPIEFLTSDQFVSQTNKDYRLYGAVFVGMIVLGIYQLFMFIILREVAYLALSINVICMLITTHNSNPVFESLRFLGDTSSYFFLTPLLLSIISTVVYTRLILDIDKSMPWVNAGLNLIIVVSLALIASVGAVPDLSILALLLGLYILVHIAVVSLYVAWKKRSAIAMYFFCIFMIPLIIHSYNLSIIIFKSAQRQASTDTNGAIGTLIFMILLAVVLAEKIRIQREKMKAVEASAKAKDDFLAVMSHELRTPMNAIMGIGALLRFSQLDNIQKKYVDQLGQASSYMMQLVNNALDFSKVKNDSFELEQSAFRLDLALHSVRDMLELRAENKGLSLNLIGDELLQSAIVGDRNHLSQVLINLAGNAIKFTEEGEVTIEVKQLTSSSDKTVRLEFNVIDTGFGISEENMKGLFDPYQQVKNQYADYNEGVGLGLAISKSLVELMGGKLQVDSKLGKGSRFYFELEFETTEQQVTQPEIGLRDLHNFLLPTGIQILLTDDAPLNRFVGGEMVKNMGGIVSLANSGENAIVQLQQRQFDVLLLDISLPGKSGIEVCEWVRKHSLNRNIPIIALTAHNLSGIRQKCLDAGMNGFLSKPFEYQDLHQAISSVLEERQLQEAV